MRTKNDIRAANERVVVPLSHSELMYICYFKFSKNSTDMHVKRSLRKNVLFHPLSLSFSVRGVCVRACIGQMLTVFDLIINVLINNLQQNAGRFVYSVTIVNQIHRCGVCVCLYRRTIADDQYNLMKKWPLVCGDVLFLFIRHSFVGHFIYVLVVVFLFFPCSSFSLSSFMSIVRLAYVLDRIKALVLANISFSLFSSSPAHRYTHERR